MDILSENVSAVDLQKFEKVYQEQLYNRSVTLSAQFDYAWCLVRSKYPVDIKKGVVLLEDLCNLNKEGQRDYLYYLALGNGRLKEYSKALDYVRAFLSIEPGNQQVIALETAIKKRMDKEGMVGMAVAGGVVLAVGALVGLGIAATKK